MSDFESDCIRTVTFFKIPVYSIKAFFHNAQRKENVMDMTSSGSWSLTITPIRKVNIAHLTNSLVQKLIQVSPDDTSNLPQILKFKSILPPKLTLDSSQSIKFECSAGNRVLQVQSLEGSLGDMDGTVICHLLAKVYFDSAYRGLPCPDLLKNIKKI